MATQSGEAETKQDETSATTQPTSIEQTPEFQKALSDHLAKAGREAKALAEQKAAIEKERLALETWRKERAEAEDKARLQELEDALKDAPDDRTKRNITTAKSYLEKKIAEAKAENDRLESIKKEIADNAPLVEEIKATKFLKQVAELAVSEKVDTEALKSLVISEGLKDIETVKIAAKAMPKVTLSTPKPDSGKSAGNFDVDINDITKMSPAEYQKNRDAIYERLRAKQNRK